MKALSGILLDLARAVRSAPATEFKEQALAAVREYLPFDSALWGTFVRSQDETLVHAFHLYNQPERMLQDYEAVKQYDQVASMAVAKAGRTFNVSTSESRVHAKLLAFIRRYNMEHMLATVWIDPVLNVWTALSFYRSVGGNRFTERERRLKQELMPHLTQAWNANEILYVERPLSYAQNLHNSCAIVDRDGIIYNADHGFADLLRAEYPGWLGPHLPPAMVSSVVRADGENYRGEAVVAVRLREIEYGMYLIGLRPLARVDRLSSKELAVAREFAAGRTYKEIAQSFGVSPATVHNQLHAVYAKLGVGSKIGLAKQLANPE